MKLKLGIKTAKHKKHDFYESLAGNKLVILFLLVLIILARKLSRTVLNLPDVIIWIKYIIPLCVCVFVFVQRYLRDKSYYKKKIKDWSELVILFLNLIFFTTLIWLVLHVLLSSLIIMRSTKTEERFNCEISTIYTINADRLQYIFKDKKYIIQLSNGHKSADDLLRNYYIEITATKSIFNTYILESYRLNEKKENMSYD